MSPRTLPPKFIAERLADVFVAGRVEAPAALDRLSAVLGHRHPWLATLTNELCVQFGSGVRPRPAPVVAAILESETFGKVLRRQRIQIPPHVELHDAMVPIPALAEARVPSILSREALAEWLGVSVEQLLWLADPGYRERQPESEPLQHYRYTWRTKRHGVRRLIESPKPTLKAMQRRVLKEILDRIPPHTAAHGFCRGRSLQSFVAPHVGRDFVLAIDLEAFFASVGVPRVRAVYRAAGYPDGVACLLAGLSTNVPPKSLWNIPGRVGSSPKERWIYDRPHLPQGAPTSPALANLCAFGLDRRLRGLADWAGAQYTRYADDIVFSGGAEFRRRAERVHVYAASIAGDEGFRLNTRKTRRLTRSMRQVVAGIVVNDRTNVRREDYDRLKATLTNCIRHGPESQNRDDHCDFRNHLLGRVSWIASLNAERGQRLRKLFDQIVWSDDDSAG
ncbi:MAG: reverse transcriptase family protein [Planctomycetota bacterium]